MRLALLLLLASPLAAQAQPLGDPLRPPTAPSAAAAGSESPSQGSATELQSVLLSPTRKLAVINGQTVALGGRIGDATLTQVTETGVVLRRGDKLESLRLLPGLEKKKVAGAARSKGGKP